MGAVTTVKMSKKTRDELAQLGKKNETYEDVIRRLMDFYIKNGLPKELKRDSLVK